MYLFFIEWWFFNIKWINIWLGSNALSNKDLNKARKEGIKYGIIIILTSILSFIIEYYRFWYFSLFGEKLINDFKRKIFQNF